MDFKKCEALLAAIDTGSFTKAAEQLHYTPSGISHMMTNLEAELGFPLLYRSKNRCYAYAQRVGIDARPAGNGRLRQSL